MSALGVRPWALFPILFITLAVLGAGLRFLLRLALRASSCSARCTADQVVAGIAVRLGVLVVGFTAFCSRMWLLLWLGYGGGGTCVFL